MGAPLRTWSFISSVVTGGVVREKTEALRDGVTWWETHTEYAQHRDAQTDTNSC